MRHRNLSQRAHVFYYEQKDLSEVCVFFFVKCRCVQCQVCYLQVTFMAAMEIHMYVGKKYWRFVFPHVNFLFRKGVIQHVKFAAASDTK